MVNDRRMRGVSYAVDAYLGDLARRGRTKDTRTKYQQILWKLDAFTDPKDVDEITADDCRRFLDQWINASASTMALHVSILRGFFEFLIDETIIERSPMERIRRPPRKRPEDLDVVTVAARDVERLFSGCEDWQELLCVSVLAYLGPRRRAASFVRRRDVDLERGTIRFREKGGKATVKPLPDELAAIIRAADENHVWSSGAAYLIPNRRPHRNPERSPKVIYDTVKKLAARVGVTTHVHALRAAFAVQFDEQNPGRVIALKELLGHARVETTMVYLRRKNKALEMESVRGLSWGSVFPHNAVVPPAGFEPALRP
jgi:integrase